ncbi:YihY/virulence factor BrkB family protein [Hamadaea sp. NPDC050747]|uniref:YihY/virulence factor BrkB family protein n=1 Tax=Hamadaea sp. NPDC050747 TaxID=3155789 RepID=UPI0033DB36E7
MAAARKRSGVFDNFWGAKERYSEVLGGRLAAAIAYYAFFALFALSLVAFSVFGIVFSSNDAVKGAVTDWLAQTLPTFQPEQLQANSTAIGIFGLVGLVLTGLGWVDAFRTSQRAIWRLEQHPGNLFVRRVVDLGMLLALTLVLGLSLAVIDLSSALFGWISGDTSSVWLTLATAAVTLLVNSFIGAALLTVLPRLHVQPRRLIPPAIAVGVGVSLLNWGGRAYFTHSLRFYPTATVIATTGVLLLYLYFFNQIVLWGAALAATSTRGRFIDLAAGPRPADPPEGRPESADPPADNPAGGATGSPGT